MPRGIIASWNKARGCGGITREKHEGTLFFHVSNLNDTAVNGDQVTFALEWDTERDRYQAINIVRIRGAPRGNGAAIGNSSSVQRSVHQKNRHKDMEDHRPGKKARFSGEYEGTRNHEGAESEAPVHDPAEEPEVEPVEEAQGTKGPPTKIRYLADGRAYSVPTRGTNEKPAPVVQCTGDRAGRGHEGSWKEWGAEADAPEETWVAQALEGAGNQPATNTPEEGAEEEPTTPGTEQYGTKSAATQTTLAAPVADGHYLQWQLAFAPKTETQEHPRREPQRGTVEPEGTPIATCDPYQQDGDEDKYEASRSGWFV
jgi:cold shock CspA family protein